MPEDNKPEKRSPRSSVLKQKTKTEAIYEKMRKRLQRGEITPGERILDYEVAEEFDCTRMTVRHVLLRLVNEGYLIGTTRGFVVKHLTDKDIREIYEVRRILEPAAAAIAATQLDAAHLKVLELAYRKALRAHKAGDSVALSEAIGEYRDGWLAALGNDRLRMTIQHVNDHPKQVRQAMLQNTRAQKDFLDTMAVLHKGFVERDPKLVKETELELLLGSELRYFALRNVED